jgi:hypothetical protein
MLWLLTGVTGSPTWWPSILLMNRFPYLITFTIDEAAHSVNVLRAFNTFQEPMG